MNEKILEEFDILTREGGVVWLGWTWLSDEEVNIIKSFFSDKLDQARAEEREKVEYMRNSPPPYPADKENPMKHIYQNEGYGRVIDDILSQR